MDNQRILTIKEVSKQMQVSTRTVRRWIKDDKLKASCFGHRTLRVLEEDLIEFIKDKRIIHYEEDSPILPS